jgi:kynurenine 3-monooxygenase
VLLALLLAKRGQRVAMFEARPDPRVNPLPGGRSINLTLAERGWKALRVAGVEEVVRGISLPLKGRHIHAEGGQVRFQPYSANGDAIFSASRAELTTRLLDLAEQQPGITVHFGHRCLAVDVERRAVELAPPAGGRLELRPARLLAADGAFSAVRRSLLRDPRFSFYQRLSTICYRELKLPPTPSGDFAFSPDGLHIWPRGDGMIVGFPNLDRSFTVSVFMPAHGALSFASLSDRGALEQFLWESCPDLAAAVDAPAHDFFNGTPAPLLSCGCAPWVHGGGWLALIGDAAHTLVPFLGQGLNAGFEDCRVLLECLNAIGDWGEALLAFQEQRLDNCEAVITLAEQHFDELARGARDPGFVQRKALEERLHAVAPNRFVPLYTMVAFACDSYLEIARLRSRHEEVLDGLLAVPRLDERWDEPEVQTLIRDALARLDDLTASAAAVAG